MRRYAEQRLHWDLSLAILRSFGHGGTHAQEQKGPAIEASVWYITFVPSLRETRD